MKALTLWQPWASLVADGIKTVETRGWATAYRGPLAIHAAATRRGVTTAHPALLRAVGDFDALPFGVVVATCELVDVEPCEHIAWGDELGWRLDVERNATDYVAQVYVGLDQRPLGGFGPGRYAWLLDRILPLADPIPAKGYQRLWNLPDLAA